MLFLWLWQSPQSLTGILLWFLLRGPGFAGRMHPFRNAWLVPVHHPKLKGGLSLGPFLFFFSNATPGLVAHEYGHTMQSRFLGPFYLPLIGFPSLFRASVISAGLHNPRSYDSFFPERHATRTGRDYFGIGA